MGYHERMRSLKQSIKENEANRANQSNRGYEEMQRTVAHPQRTSFRRPNQNMPPPAKFIDEEAEDDDVDIIPLANCGKWSQKVQSQALSESYDHSFVSDSVQIRDDISEISGIDPMRRSCVLSNTLKYGQPSSKFQRQLMVNRLRRKRKHPEEQQHERGAVAQSHAHYEPPKKKTNLEAMTSRDLKSLLHRIHKPAKNSNALLRKSVPNMASFSKRLRASKPNTAKYKNPMAASTSFSSSRRIRNVMKKIFNSDTEGDDDVRH